MKSALSKSLFILSAAAILFLTSSCNKTIFDETRTFANDTWMRFSPEKFEVNAPSTEDCYNFVVTLTIDTNIFHEAGLPIILEIANPENETRTMFATLLFRNHEGTVLGHLDENGNLVITQTVREYYFFNTTGVHHISLSQRTSKYEIHGIKQLNLHIEKSKLDYPD